jgi:hypothetical protein
MIPLIPSSGNPNISWTPNRSIGQPICLLLYAGRIASYPYPSRVVQWQAFSKDNGEKRD